MQAVSLSTLGSKLGGIVVAGIKNVSIEHHDAYSILYEGDDFSLSELVHHSLGNLVVIQFQGKVDSSHIKLVIPVGIRVLINPQGVVEWMGKTLCKED